MQKNNNKPADNLLKWHSLAYMIFHKNGKSCQSGFLTRGRATRSPSSGRGGWERLKRCGPNENIVPDSFAIKDKLPTTWFILSVLHKWKDHPQWSCDAQWLVFQVQYFLSFVNNYLTLFPFINIQSIIHFKTMALETLARVTNMYWSAAENSPPPPSLPHMSNLRESVAV